RRVHVLPSNDGARHANHVVGTITGVSTGSNGTTLTIQPADGTSAKVSVLVTSATRIRPQGKTVADLTANTKVTVVMRNGTATGRPACDCAGRPSRGTRPGRVRRAVRPVCGARLPLHVLSDRETHGRRRSDRAGISASVGGHRPLPLARQTVPGLVVYRGSQ